MAVKPLPPAEYLRECFNYDPDTGELTWRERPREHFGNDRAWKCFNSSYSGNPAGGRPAAHRLMVRLTDADQHTTKYYAHRIIWRLVHDVDPGATLIDHIDGDGYNNRLSNLRLADRSENAWNRRAQIEGRPKGVYRLRGRWCAQIQVNKKSTYLGLFDTAEAAHDAYCRAASELHGEFARFQ